MPLTHLLLALAVVAVWGSNFVVIKFGLSELPPLLLATMRFGLSALPWLLFIKRPAVAWRYLIAYGVLIGFMFGLLFLAMRSDVSPGLASLLMQSQVFMTLLLVAWLQHERMPRAQFAGLALATLGFALIAWQSFPRPTPTSRPWASPWPWVAPCAGPAATCSHAASARWTCWVSWSGAACSRCRRCWA